MCATAKWFINTHSEETHICTCITCFVQQILCTSHWQETVTVAVSRFQSVPTFQGDHCRRLTHYHYLAWPDFGIPEKPVSLIRFVRMVRSRVGTTGGPIIVHCRFVRRRRGRISSRTTTRRRTGRKKKMKSSSSSRSSSNSSNSSGSSNSSSSSNNSSRSSSSSTCSSSSSSSSSSSNCCSCSL